MGGGHKETGDTGKALLLHHRELIAMLHRLEEAIAEHQRGESDELCRQRIARELIPLINGLRSHFKSEGESRRKDFEDVPHFFNQLLRLDQEHPRIVSGFEEVARKMERRDAPVSICETLGQAIARFREHEAQEDGLFDSD